MGTINFNFFIFQLFYVASYTKVYIITHVKIKIKITLNNITHNTQHIAHKELRTLLLGKMT